MHRNVLISTIFLKCLMLFHALSLINVKTTIQLLQGRISGGYRGLPAMFSLSCAAVLARTHKKACRAQNFIYRARMKKDLSIFQFPEVTLCYSSAEENTIQILCLCFPEFFAV